MLWILWMYIYYAVMFRDDLNLWILPNYLFPKGSLCPLHGYMEYFMYSSLLCQLNVHNIVKEPGRVNLPGTFNLSAFMRELLILVKDPVTNKKLTRKS